MSEVRKKMSFLRNFIRSVVKIEDVSEVFPKKILRNFSEEFPQYPSF